MPYIIGIAAIPRGFDTVHRVDIRGDHHVLRAASGKTVRHAVDLSFLPSAP